MEYTKSHAVLKTVVFMCRLSVSGSRLMLQNWTRIVLNITIAICMIQYITFLSTSVSLCRISFIKTESLVIYVYGE